MGGPSRTSYENRVKRKKAAEKPAVTPEILPSVESSAPTADFNLYVQWAMGNHGPLRPEDVAQIYREQAARTAAYIQMGVATRMQRTQKILRDVDLVERALNDKIPEMDVSELMRLRDARAGDAYRHISKMAPDASRVENIVGPGGANRLLTDEEGTAAKPISAVQRSRLAELGAKVRANLVAIAAASVEPSGEPS